MSSSVERAIAKAIENGEFDDLPGRGEPLSIEALARDEDLAHRLLVDHGYALPWIEVRQQIEKDFAQASKRLSQRMAWLQREGTQPRSSSSWDNELASFKQEVEELNKRIDDYNLSVPLAQFQRRRYDAEAEIQRLTAG